MSQPESDMGGQVLRGIEIASDPAISKKVFARATT